MCAVEINIDVCSKRIYCCIGLYVLGSEDLLFLRGNFIIDGLLR